MPAPRRRRSPHSTIQERYGDIFGTSLDDPPLSPPTAAARTERPWGSAAPLAAGAGAGPAATGRTLALRNKRQRQSDNEASESTTASDSAPEEEHQPLGIAKAVAPREESVSADDSPSGRGDLEPHPNVDVRTKVSTEPGARTIQGGTTSRAPPIHKPSGLSRAVAVVMRPFRPELPVVAGPQPFGLWTNRFGLPPGGRWDGIDRSNGFEVALHLGAR